MRKKFVDCAKAFYGVARGTERHRQLIDAYNSVTPHPRGYAMTYTADWCAAFVSAIAVLCDMTDIIPVECSCNEQIKLWKAKGRWQENDAHKPLPGDIVYYDWQDTGRGDNAGAADHVGIVVWRVGGNMLVIEGNKGAESVVGYRELNVNGRYIRGYGLPEFEAAEHAECSVTLPVLARGVTGEDVKALQMLLNLRRVEVIDVDGSFGAITRAAVISFQREHELTADGVVELKTWTTLLRGRKGG